MKTQNEKIRKWIDIRYKRIFRIQINKTKNMGSVRIQSDLRLVRNLEHEDGA